MTLNQFHQAGLGESDASSSYSQFKKIIGAKSPKNITCEISFVEGHLANNISEKKPSYKAARRCAHSLIDTSLQDLVKSHTLFYGINTDVKETVKVWRNLAKCIVPKFCKPCVVRLYLKAEVLVARSLSIISIVKKLTEWEDMIAVPRPEWEASIDIIFETSALTTSAFTKDADIDAVISRKLKEVDCPKNRQQNLQHHYCKFTVLPLILKTQISGVPRVNKVEVIVKGGNHKIIVHLKHAKDKVDNYLSTIMAYDWVDSERIRCNDMHETCRVFGIEAAANVLQEQITQIVGFGKTYVHPKHYQQLVLSICMDGYMQGATRHGMSLEESGPLTMASFEETMNVLVKASFMGQPDNLDTVSSLIMVDSKLKTGTAIHETRCHKKLSDVIEVDW